MQYLNFQSNFMNNVQFLRTCCQMNAVEFEFAFFIFVVISSGSEQHNNMTIIRW